MSNQSIFSADALKARRAKPLSLPTYFLRLPSAATIALIVASAAVAMGWAVFAKVPIKVPGRAVVVNVNDVKPMNTKSSGRILIVSPPISATRSTFDYELYRFYNSEKFSGSIPDLIQTVNDVLFDTSPAQLANYSKLVKNAGLLEDISTSRFPVSRGQVVTIVFNEDSRTKLSNELISAREEYETNNLVIKRASNNLRSLLSQASGQYQIVVSYKKLKELGAASEVNLLQAVQEYARLKKDISDTRNNINQLETKNKSLANQLQSKLVEYITNQYVFAEGDGFISNLSKGNEQYSDINQPVLFFSSQPSSSLPPWIVGFTDDRSANLIRDGMQVIATPQGVNKSQYGGISGFVSTKVPYTMTSQRLSNIVGIESLANISSKSTSAPNLIVIRLAMDATGSSYKWTTSQAPPVTTGIGDVLDLDISIQEQSPLMMAIPFIKKYLGLDGPTDFTEGR